MRQALLHNKLCSASQKPLTKGHYSSWLTTWTDASKGGMRQAQGRKYPHGMPEELKKMLVADECAMVIRTAGGSWISSRALSYWTSTDGVETVRSSFCFLWPKVAHSWHRYPFSGPQYQRDRQNRNRPTDLENKHGEGGINKEFGINTHYYI